MAAVADRKFKRGVATIEMFEGAAGWIAPLPLTAVPCCRGLCFASVTLGDEIQEC